MYISKNGVWNLLSMKEDCQSNVNHVHLSINDTVVLSDDTLSSKYVRES